MSEADRRARAEARRARGVTVERIDMRDADPRDLSSLATLWFDGWQDAHAGLLPPEVAADRTVESFRNRLSEHLGSIRTMGEVGEPLGFSFVKRDELYQFYVAAAARGTGVAAALMADAEERLRAAGVPLAWLDCAIGNERAARFYEKSGWRRAGVVTTELDLSGRRFPLDIWRYEKALSAPAGAPRR